MKQSVANSAMQKCCGAKTPPYNNKTKQYSLKIPKTKTDVEERGPTIIGLS